MPNRRGAAYMPIVMPLADHPAYAWLRRASRARPRLHGFVRLLKYGPYLGWTSRRPRDEALRAALARGGCILYLGSGGRRQRGMINLDVTPVTGPDVVGDGFQLPFADETFDAIFCEYVIEHVPDPERFLAAASRTLKRDGRWYIEAPFLQPGHGAPYDFTRWTLEGFRLAAARSGLAVEAAGMHSAPGFTLHWVLKDTLALTFSLGWAPLRRTLVWVFGWALAPLLALDPLLSRLSGAEGLASGWWIVACRAAPADCG